MAAEALPVSTPDHVGKLGSDSQPAPGQDVGLQKSDENSVVPETISKQSPPSENGPVLTPVHRNGYQIPAQRQSKQAALHDNDIEKSTTETQSSPAPNHTSSEPTSNHVDRVNAHSNHSTAQTPDVTNSPSKSKPSFPNTYDQPRFRGREGDQHKGEVENTNRAPSKQVYDAPHRRSHPEANSVPSSSSSSTEALDGPPSRYTRVWQQQRVENRRGMGRMHPGSGSAAAGNGGGSSASKPVRQGMQGAGRGSQQEGRMGGRQQQSLHRGDRAVDVATVMPPGLPGAPAPSTDLERFLVQVTPMLQLDQSLPQEQAMLDLLLEDVWRFYCEPSLYGREVYTLGGQRGPSLSYFVPYLSAMQLFVPASPGDPGTRTMYVCDVDGWPKHMHMVYEYFEHGLPFNRAPLYTLIETLSKNNNSLAGSAAGGGGANGEGFQGSVLQRTRIASLHPASWFAVAWYPVYRIPDAPLTARFLTFHSFAPLWMMSMRPQGNSHAASERREQQPAQPVFPLQVVGLKWYNMMGERWFDNLSDTVTDQRSSAAADSRTEGGSGSPGAASDAGSDRGSTSSLGSGAGNSNHTGSSHAGRGGKRQPQHSNFDYMWQAHLSELQASADRLSRGVGLRVLGQMGAEDAVLNHPDYDFFNSRI